MRSRHQSQLLAATIVATTSAQAATIANWKVLFAASPLTVGTVTTSGLTTDSPVFGGAANNMDGVAVAGRFGTTGSPESVTLAVGETLNVSATITLTGGTTPPGGNYRFAVQNDGGKFAADNPDLWDGGWVHTVGGSLYQANTGGNYMSVLTTTPNNAVNLAPVTTTTGIFSGNSATPYTWTMSITRASSTTVDVVSSFIGGSGNYSQTMTETAIDTSVFTYTALGLQATGQVDLDQMTVSNAQFSVVPEPSAALLGGLGALALLLRRRN